jgi:group I intron endonuclease
MNDNWNVGIYQIRNILTGDLYIGQSVNLKQRKYSHFKDLKKNKHRNQRLQNVYNKYGDDVFVFEILLYCEREFLTYYEQGMVDSLNPSYNICRECVNSSKGRVVSLETRKKISEFLNGNVPWNKGFSYPDELKQSMCKPHKMKEYSEEERKNIWGHKIWNKGKIWSEDQRKNSKNRKNAKGSCWSDERKQTFTPWNKGQPSPFKGQKYSEEMKKAIREKKEQNKIRKLSENV